MERVYDSVGKELEELCNADVVEHLESTAQTRELSDQPGQRGEKCKSCKDAEGALWCQ